VHKLESLQTLFTKRELWLSPAKPSHVVRLETGRVKLRYHVILQCLRFWFKILLMGNERLPRIKSLSESSYWHCTEYSCGQLREILNKSWFSFVWSAQDPVILASNLPSIMPEVSDIALNEDLSALAQSPYLVNLPYSLTFSQMKPAKYLRALCNFSFKRLVFQIRSGSTKLNCGARYIQLCTQNCSLCDLALPAYAAHFFFICPFLQERIFG